MHAKFQPKRRVKKLPKRKKEKKKNNALTQGIYNGKRQMMPRRKRKCKDKDIYNSKEKMRMKTKS